MSFPARPPFVKVTSLTEIPSANENTVNAGKKTIAPADVFKALEETEFAFLREPLEAEFASTSISLHPVLCPLGNDGLYIYYLEVNQDC